MVGSSSKQHDAKSGTVQAGASVLPTSRVEEVKTYRKKCALLTVILVVACVAGLGIGVTRYTFYSPTEVAGAICAWFEITFNQLFCGKVYTTPEITAISPCYYQVINRIGITFIAALCGVILTISGMVYQTVFRNPVAAPTMLGVAGGLNMGLLIFVWVYGAMATYETVPHYLFAYGGGVVALVLVLTISRLINGKKWFSVVDMLMVGSIVSQVFAQIVLYVSYYVFSDDQWLIYTNINEVLTVNTDPVAYVFLITAFLVSFIPIFMLRFRLNALGFSPEEARGLGVDQTRLRYGSLFIATIMIIAAMAHSGMVGMAALIVPFISRAYFGAETRKQLTGNILLGAILVVVCRHISAVLTVFLMNAGFAFEFPIGVVASLVCMPIFVWIIAKQQRTWD